VWWLATRRLWGLWSQHPPGSPSPAQRGDHVRRFHRAGVRPDPKLPHLRADTALVTPEATFADLGRTSFAELELLTSVEDHFRITLDAETYLDPETVGSLADAIGAAMSDRHAQLAGN
jgi:acyl carrier protein